jgi:hypothetical protein
LDWWGYWIILFTKFLLLGIVVYRLVTDSGDAACVLFDAEVKFVWRETLKTAGRGMVGRSAYGRFALLR